MLGVVENPLRTPSRRGDGAGRRRDGRRRHLPPDAGRRVLRRPGPARGEQVADPYFGGAGPDRNACIALRRVHDRLPAQRQEHPGQELPLPRRAGRRRRSMPLTTVTRVRPRSTAAATTSTSRCTKAKRRRRSGHEDAHRRAGGLRGRRARHPEAAAPDEGRGPPAAALATGSGTSPAPTPSRSSARSRPTRPIDYSQGVAITSSFHPDEHTHIEPVRYGKGSNAMALLQTVLTDGDGAGPRWRTWLKELWIAAPQRPATSTT